MYKVRKGEVPIGDTAGREAPQPRDTARSCDAADQAGRHQEPDKLAMHTQHPHAQVGAFKKVTTLWRRRRLATGARVFTRAQGKGGGRGGLASAPPPRREWRPGRHRRRDRHRRPRVSPGQAPCRHLRTSHNISRRVHAGDPGRPEVMHHERTRIASDLTRGARGLPAP